MNEKCPCRHSQYMYHASAYGLMGDYQRPSQQSVPMQGSVVLPLHGGHVTQRMPKFALHGLVTFEEVYVEVGGSFDHCHDRETSYALAMIEKLNIAGMLTADRVVARMAAYSPMDNHGGEHTFDITGSYFENLKIAGHPVEIKLSTDTFHQYDSYSSFNDAYEKGKVDHLLLFHKLGDLEDKELAQLEEQYHALYGMSRVVKRWKTEKGKRKNAQPAGERKAKAGVTDDAIVGPRHRYWCSAAGHLDSSKVFGENSEIKTHGPVICIPKFGVIRLAEMLITRDSRTLTMVRVEMCSSGHGTTSGPTTNTGGGTGFP